MLNNIKNYLETHMNVILISIEQYKALFDIIFLYDFVTPKNELTQKPFKLNNSKLLSKKQLNLLKKKVP
jgi:hypothetical protein